MLVALRNHAFVLLLLLLCVLPGRVKAQRAIPDDNLAYPVLIKLSDCGSNIASIQGSGFFLDTPSAQYLVTARHVLFNEAERTHPLQCKKAELMAHSKDPKEQQENHIELDLQQLNGTGKIKAHTTKDVAVVQIGIGSKQQNQFALVPGVRAIAIAPSGFLMVGLSTIKTFDEVLTANDVYVLGYPESIGIQQAPQIDYNAPLLRKGIVAGLNNSNKTIVLDCLTFFGNSGGPVLQAVHVGFSTRFDVIGVISQYVPFAETWVNTTLSYANVQVHNSGYSIAEPMDAVLELVGEPATKPAGQ